MSAQKLPNGMTITRDENETILRFDGGELLAGAFRTSIPVGWVTYSHGAALYVGADRVDAEDALIHEAAGGGDPREFQRLQEAMVVLRKHWEGMR